MATNADARQGQGGFSLVELMIALVVTLVVSGAIYGLIASGQSAFKRDPEISDRQQNVRVAMAMIQRDLVEGGSGMVGNTQVFSQNLADWSATKNKPSGAAQAYGDALEIFQASSTCPLTQVTGVNGVNLTFMPPGAPSCLPNNSFVLVYYTDPNNPNVIMSKWGLLHDVHGENGKANF